jgi:hypothetical protein
LKNPKQKARVPGSSIDLSLLAQSTTRRQLARQRAIEFAPAVSSLKKFARKHGLSVRRLQFARRCVVLSGNIDQMTKAFGQWYASMAATVSGCSAHDPDR